MADRRMREVHLRDSEENLIEFFTPLTAQEYELGTVDGML